jgi:ABC-2 type transport system permease protein
VAKYWEFFKIDFAQGLHHRAAALGKIGFYGIILFIFAKLWEVTEKSVNLDLTPQTLVWYLALTELLVLCYPFLHVEIDEDVRSGNLAYSLLRPASYFWSRYFRGLGAVSSRLLILIVGGLAFPFLFGGGMPEKPLGLLYFLPLALASVATGLVFQLAIGICSFWTQDSNPLYWVWQKSTFILGGLILPLEIYPDWLRKAADYSPFPYMLYKPVMATLRADPLAAAECVAMLALWFLVGLGLTFTLFYFARKNLVLNGG